MDVANHLADKYFFFMGRAHQNIYDAKDKHSTRSDMQEKVNKKEN